MASINLKNKSKTDLVAIVRMSGVMPISRAQRMTKAELIAQLETIHGDIIENTTGDNGSSKQTDEEILLQSAPGRLAARKLSEDRKTAPAASTPERRSVFVSPEDLDSEVSKPIRRSVMAAPPATEEPAEPTAAKTSSSSMTDNRNKSKQSTMLPKSDEVLTSSLSEEAAAEPAKKRTASNGRRRKSVAAEVTETTSDVSNSTISTDESSSEVDKKPASKRNTRSAAPKRKASPAKTKTSVNEDDKAAATSDSPAAEETTLPEKDQKKAGNSTAGSGRGRPATRQSKAAAENADKKAADREQTAVKSESRTRISTESKVMPASEQVKAAPASAKIQSGSKDEQPEREENRSQRNHTRNQVKRQQKQRNGRYVPGHKSDHIEVEDSAPQTVQAEPESILTVSDSESTGEAAEASVAKDKAARQSFDSGEVVSGVMELMPDGYGFLRRDNYLQGPKDIYMPPQLIRRFNLREGDFITGPTRIQREQDRYQALYFIKSVNGVPPEQVMRRPNFDRLTPIYPNQRFKLETTKNELSTRIIDLIAPIGKGQRGMIVSPPKAGKTILLQKIANAISINNPESKLIVLLIDERPEEVTDMQRSINGEVVYSTFDKTPENHVKITELVLERAERLVEMGQDVIILMDSLTRMARAYNLTINPTGRTLSGGLDPGALYGPKRFFGAARNIENGGSLTIVATALIDTGSRMDEVIFEEFKGTGNMEVYLDRKLSEKRIFPAIDINRSGTRREELLLTEQELEAIWSIRKAFGQLDSSNVTETIMNLLMKTNDNHHFVSSVNVSLNNKSLYDSMKLGGGKSGQQNNHGV